MSADWVEIGSGRLWVVDEGRGLPVIFLHGFSFDGRQWTPQVDAMADRYRCIVPDLRGFGQSPFPREGYDHASDLADLIAALGLGRVVIVGLSLGANIAATFAARHPEMMAGLVLVSSGLRGHEWSEERPPDAARAYAVANGVAATKTFWLNHPMFGSLNDYPEARAMVQQMVTDYSGWHWANADPQEFTPVGQDPSQVRCPTLVVSGARDAAGYREIAVAIAGMVPGAQLQTFEDAGHMLPLEQPARFNRLLGDFLDALEPMP